MSLPGDETLTVMRLEHFDYVATGQPPKVGVVENGGEKRAGGDRLEIPGDRLASVGVIRLAQCVQRQLQQLIVALPRQKLDRPIEIGIEHLIPTYRGGVTDS